MDTYQSIVESLQRKGFRITLIRSALIRVFSQSRMPLAVEAVLNKLKAHKVTVYREIDFLVQQNILQSVAFGDRKKRFELASRPHHHHAVCVKCNRIEDVMLDGDLQKEIRIIEKNKKFVITSHSLEFFGLCNNCLAT
ncbi:MAG: Fur family transcriptional regulator [Patescibacteria group bacterium]|jgi:Fur family ferric uptake transcriptional regulator